MTAELPTQRAQGEAAALGRGSTIRTVVDYSDAWPCYVPVGRDLCQLKRGHVGGHLGYPATWPVEAVSADNPRSDRGIPACFDERYDPSPDPIIRRIS